MMPRIALLRGHAADLVRPFQPGAAKTNRSTTEGGRAADETEAYPVEMLPVAGHQLVDPRLAAFEARCAELEAKCAELEAEMAMARREQERQQKEAVEVAYRAGAASVTKSEERAHALLAEAIQNALDRLGRTLDSLEDGAVAIARSSLEPILGHNAPLERITLAAIRRQLTQLRGNALMELRLSPSLGLEVTAVTQYLERLGHTGIPALLDTVIPTGAVALKLRLGEIELNIARHAQEVRAILDAGASEPPAISEAGSP